jgi:hypothetical protein
LPEAARGKGKLLTDGCTFFESGIKLLTMTRVKNIIVGQSVSQQKNWLENFSKVGVFEKRERTQQAEDEFNNYLANLEKLANDTQEGQ